MNSRAVQHTLGLGALALAFLLFGCADFSRGPGVVPPDTAVADTGGGGDATAGDGEDTGGGCVPGDYATEIYPLVQLSCDSCHSSSGSAGSSGLVFTGSAADDHAMIVALVDTGNPAGSTLVRKGTGVQSHGGGALFTPGGAEEQALICWIGAGAPQ